MKLTRNRVIGAVLVILVAVLGIGQHLLEKEAIAQTTGKVMVPRTGQGRLVLRFPELGQEQAK